MGTHPIFESDFDCLTDAPLYMNSVGENATTVRYDPALTKVENKFSKSFSNLFFSKRSVTKTKNLGSILTGDVGLNVSYASD